MFFNFFKNEEKLIKIGYEDVLYGLKYTEQYLIISTLPPNDQECLIKNTLLPEKEISIIDNYMLQQQFNMKIIIYGLNNCDLSVEKKYKQLIELGFNNVHIYVGGLFEWLMLQDIYGKTEFPTTKYILDILKYRPKGNFNILRIT